MKQRLYWGLGILILLIGIVGGVVFQHQWEEIQQLKKQVSEADKHLQDKDSTQFPKQAVVLEEETTKLCSRCNKVVDTEDAHYKPCGSEGPDVVAGCGDSYWICQDSKHKVLICKFQYYNPCDKEYRECTNPYGDCHTVLGFYQHSNGVCSICKGEGACRICVDK